MKPKRTDPAYLEWARLWDEYASAVTRARKRYLRELKAIEEKFPDSLMQMPPEPPATAAERLLSEIEVDQ